jgi:hypothetical protein
MAAKFLVLSLSLAALCGCAGRSATPLVAAARTGRIEEIRALIQSGADPNQRAGVNDWTPLMHAIHKQQRGSVRALLEGGADVNAFGGDSNPLIMAAGYGDTETVRLLLDHGAKPELATRQGVTALAAAATGVPDIDNFTAGHCQTATVQLLVERHPELKLPENRWGRFATLIGRASGCSELLK